MSASLAFITPEPTTLVERIEVLERRIGAVEATQPSDKVTILAFSGDFDKLLTAFVIATGAAAMGSEVTMFFTFWGLHGIKKKTRFKGKKISEKMVAAMLPAVCGNTSKLNMLGIGPRFFQYLMKQKKVAGLKEMLETARELGIKMIACQMSMDVMGIHRDELIDDVEIGGVAKYIAEADDSRVSLFI